MRGRVAALTIARAPSALRTTGNRVSGAANQSASPKHRRSRTASQNPDFELQPEMKAKIDPGAKDTPHPHHENEKRHSEREHYKHAARR